MNNLPSIAFVSIATTLILCTVACGDSDDGGATNGGNTPATSSTSPTSPTSPGASSGPPSSSGTVPSSGTDSTCVKITQTLCEKACSCTGSGSCIVKYPVATEEHDSLADCMNFYRFFVCGDPKYAAEYETSSCQAAMPAAQCAASDKGNALAFPEGCKAP